MTEVILPGLAGRLKPLRNEKKMTQKEMAALLDCTEGHYQKIEYGKINLSALQLMELADFFGVTTDYLLGRDCRMDRYRVNWLSACRGAAKYGFDRRAEWIFFSG